MDANKGLTRFLLRRETLLVILIIIVATLNAQGFYEKLGFASHERVRHTTPNGAIEGRVFTNDDQDLGYPTTSAEWDLRYRDHDDMLKRTGGTHVGISGVRVERSPATSGVASGSTTRSTAAGSSTGLRNHTWDVTGPCAARPRAESVRA